MKRVSRVFSGGAIVLLTAFLTSCVVPPPANEPPTACFTYSPPNPKAGKTMTFDASCSSDVEGLALNPESIASYEWDFGDGTTDTGKATTHAYSTADDYNVTLTVTDDDGASTQVTRVVSVSTGIRVLAAMSRAALFTQGLIDNAGDPEVASMFTVTQTSIPDFNGGNPADLSQYDVIVMGGLGDGGEGCGDNPGHYERLPELKEYAANGGGIVWTHDTLGAGPDYGPNVEEPAGVDHIGDISWRKWCQGVIEQDHEILHQPFEIGNAGEGVTFTNNNVSGCWFACGCTHTYSVVTTADIIIRFTWGAVSSINHYLTVHKYGLGRVSVLEIGHAFGCYPDHKGVDMLSQKESQIFVNTLYWASS